MTATRMLLVAVSLVFGAYSAWALWHHGYLGIWRAGLTDLAAGQILFDLVIACGLIALWMLRDARDAGRRAWPYLLLTLTAGSVGPLLYLLLSRRPAPG